MRILRILNNNVAVATADDGREVVVMGRGLAFGLRPGEAVDSTRVEKTYCIADEGTASRFQQLMRSIPMPHMLLSERIISHARLKLGKPLNDTIYVTLPDHISSAIGRYQEGIELHNPLLWDVRRFYREEFEVGRKACDVVFEETGVRFLEDEAAFIAMHFVNAELGDRPVQTVYDVTYVMQEVCAIVRTYFETAFDEDSLDYYRFITHLKFFAQRLLSGQHYNDEMDDLLGVLQYKYPDAYACAGRVAAFVLDKYGYACGAEERLYLTVHIARIIKGAAAKA